MRKRKPLKKKKPHYLRYILDKKDIVQYRGVDNEIYMGEVASVHPHTVRIVERYTKRSISRKYKDFLHILSCDEIERLDESDRIADMEYWMCYSFNTKD